MVKELPKKTVCQFCDLNLDKFRSAFLLEYQCGHAMCTVCQWLQFRQGRQDFDECLICACHPGFAQPASEVGAVVATGERVVRH